ncbi:MAG TPA: nucleotidyltransferase domain-containing protein [Gaiellaceae bacterium]|jgi:predicted nucleotidyltransferase|nr:nucleotidyltransferase domain-containing protein [Gaiellaceae bacterium]
MPAPETPTGYLRALAGRIADVVVEETEPRAILLVGSAATGEADLYSDLDLIVYCDELPPVERIDAVLERLGGAHRELIYPRDENDHGESFRLDGVECQLAFTRVSAAERELTRALGGEELESPLHKVVEGVQAGLPLRGEELIAEWRARLADYPDALRRKMIVHHWRFFPLWYTARRLAVRDTSIWRRQVLVAAALDLLAVLGALNRLYMAPHFELKRLRKLTARMTLAPPDLADRLEHLLEAESEEAADELERLVGETQALVEAELPDLELPPLRRPLGARHEPWKPA